MGGRVSQSGTSAVGRQSARFWFAHPVVQLAIAALLVAASELLLKQGAGSVAAGPGVVGLFGIHALGSRWTWGGIILYGLSFLSWLHVLRLMPLSIAFGMINVVHVLVPLGAWAILGEAISGRRWLGIGLILLGISLIARPAARAEAKL